jgi:2,3-dihydro-2,3-dihydroxybenzoate dehydrogenase
VQSRSEPDDRHGFQGTTALIVGSHRGIGFACASAFAARGARLALADIDGPGLECARARLGDATVTVHTADVSNPAACSGLISDVVAAHARLDVLINAASVLITQPFLELTPEAWDRTLGVNARGTVFLAQAAARQMISQESGGRIIVFASIVGRHTVRLDNTAYCASKAAVLQAMRCIALELAPYDITVNAISPGSTATEMLLQDQMHGVSDARDQVIKGDAGRWRLGVPLGRLAEPADQAAAALFLASPAARHITGHELCVDGGQTVV